MLYANKNKLDKHYHNIITKVKLFKTKYVHSPLLLPQYNQKKLKTAKI